MTAVRRLVDSAWSACGESHRPVVAAIAERLRRPVRVKIIGRVSAGKSTLINALVGRGIAATAAQDCTRVTTVYTYGIPDRTTAIDRDGTERVTGVGFDDRDEATADPTLSHLRVQLGSGLLKDLSLIDTPGQGSTLPTVSAPIESGELEADVLVLLFRGQLRIDDTAVLDAFREATGSHQPEAAACVGLLTHADSFGEGPWGAQDPLDLARRSAARLADRLRGHFSTVLAVSPMLAEVVRTGSLTGADHHLLRRLAALDDLTLQLSDQVPLPDDLTREQVRRLRSLVGGYGLRYGRQHAATPTELSGWLLDRSGVTAAERHISTELLPIVRRGRADRALRELVAVMGRTGFDQRLGAWVEEQIAGPAFQPVREYRAYRLLLRERPQSPLVADLARLMAADPPGGSPALFDAAARYQALVATAPRRAEAEAARVMSAGLLQRALGTAQRREV